MSAKRHDKIGHRGGSGPRPRIALAIEGKIIALRLFFQGNGLLRLGGDALRRKVIGFHDKRGFAAAAEFIVYTVLDHRGRAVFREEFADSRAKPADHIVVLGGDDAAGFLCGFEYNFRVKRLDRMHIDHACGDTVSFQQFGGFERLLNHHADRDDRDILAVGKLDAFAKLEPVARN